MIVFEKWKIALISVFVLAGAVLASPNVIGNADDDESFLGLNRINLGLDLQGGSYLLLKVELDQVIEERLSNSAEAIRSEMRTERIGIRNLDSDATSLSFDLRDANDRDRAREILSQILGRDLQIINTEQGFSASYSETGLAEIGRITVEQAIEIVRSRIDETGTKEPIIQRQGGDRILIQLPGVDNPEDVKRLLGKTARLGFQMVDISASAVEVQASGRIPPGSEILESADGSGQLYLVRKRVLISGDMLDDARPGFGQN
ncbi:MAG: protein translocase subunit SecD, partial [Alphaproteobacteria bacterium]